MKTNLIVHLTLHFFAGGPQWYGADLVQSVYIIYRMPSEHPLSCSKSLSSATEKFIQT